MWRNTFLDAPEGDYKIHSVVKAFRDIELRIINVNDEKWYTVFMSPEQFRDLLKDVTIHGSATGKKTRA